MRKLILLSGAMMLVGCSQQNEDAAVSNTSEEVISRIFLECDGMSNEPGKKPFRLTRLLSAPTANAAGQQIVEYSASDKFYKQTCATSIFSCSTRVNEDLILQDGVQLGSTLPNPMTDTIAINRRTGEIEEQSKAGSEVLASFKGTCKPGTPPEREPAKF